MNTSDVVIIGGGLAGLAASVELARQGLSVTIVDQNQHLGGKMNVLSEQGFTFDMGPTILTLPQVLRGIIERTGRRTPDYIDLIDLDPQWRCFFDDGAVIDLRRDVDQLARQLDQQFPGSGAGDGYTRFIEYSRRMYRLSDKVFFYKDLGGISDLVRKPPPSEPGILRDVLAMRLHSTVGATAHGMIREPHVRQLVEHFLQYVGSSPFLAPAILSLIAAAQVDHGCCYAMGGTRMVARALEKLGAELGVRSVLGQRVQRLRVENGRVRAALLEDGRELTAHSFVSNCDVQRTFRDLLATPEALRRHRAIARDYTPACSGLVLYLGLSRQYDHLAHHNFLFSSDSASEFRDIYTQGIPARDPTLYLAVPSRTDPSQAPPGCEALYVLIHTPYIRDGQDWHAKGGTLEQYRPVVIDKLRRAGMPDIEKHIVLERVLTPNMIDRMYNAEGGAIYGLASHGRLKGGFKPRNRSLVYPNLYLAGGSANPGPGVPMVLMSGVTAASALIEDVRGEPPSVEIKARQTARATAHAGA
ncbi:MAG: phytoene desaturase family protein [Planctomycetota bacterium]|nr:phytoene desaturase family protein [Planctomycetota bacterium]